MHRTTIVQYYFDLAGDYNAHISIPHIATSIWDSVLPTTRQAEMREMSAACFMYAQKLIDMCIVSIPDLEASFVTSGDAIRRFELSILERPLSVSLRPIDVLRRHLGDLEDESIRQNALCFFNMSLFLSAPSAEVRAEAAVEAARRFANPQIAPSRESALSDAVRACVDKLSSHTSNELGVRFSLLASASLET